MTGHPRKIDRVTLRLQFDDGISDSKAHDIMEAILAAARPILGDCRPYNGKVVFARRRAAPKTKDLNAAPTERDN